MPTTKQATPDPEIFDQAKSDLKSLVQFATVSDNPSPEQRAALEAMPSKLVDLFRGAGMTNAQVLHPPAGSSGRPNSIVYGTWGATQKGAPTVLLYAHYDVVRADGTWNEPGNPSADPFKPYEYQNRLYGRGASDDKSGIVMHLSAMRTLKECMPVNLILVVEGEEEIGTGSLDEYINNNQDKFQADVIVIADTGNVAVGKPALTTSLRGLVALDVTVSTLDHAEHSGMFGGPAPDAFMALVRMINSLVDWRGDAAVAGLTRYSDENWPPSSPDEEAVFRDQAGVLNGVQLTSSGSITRRVAGSPAICVVGLDGLPSVENSVNQLHPTATARISVRLAPDQDPEEAYQAVRTHLLNAAPLGVIPSITKSSQGEGYKIRAEGGRYYNTAIQAIQDAYPKGPECLRTGLGGTIPMINVIADVQKSKDATVVMWGCEEPICRIHGTDESVSYDELSAMICAEVNLLNYVAAQGRGGARER